MDKPWLKSYPPGMPAEISTWNQYKSIGALFEESCRKFAAKPAFHCMGKTISFGELDRLSRDFAAWLQAKGLKKGDRVALMMPNVLQYPVALFGILRAGLVVVNVNPLYTARELEHQLKDSGAAAIVILENFATTLQEVLAKTPVKHVVVTHAMFTVVNMNVEKYRAAVADVPFVDVINTMLDASIPLTAQEWEQWGNPNKRIEYRYMLQYSPYDNVAKKNYPATLVKVSLNDSQVPYWEGAKLVAKLRAMKTDKNPLLLKVNFGAGHGGASGRYDALRETAFDYAFTLWQMGISE